MKVRKTKRPFPHYSNASTLDNNALCVFSVTIELNIFRLCLKFRLKPFAEEGSSEKLY